MEISLNGKCSVGLQKRSSPFAKHKMLKYLVLCTSTKCSHRASQLKQLRKYPISQLLCRPRKAWVPRLASGPAVGPGQTIQ